MSKLDVINVAVSYCFLRRGLKIFKNLLWYCSSRKKIGKLWSSKESKKDTKYYSLFKIPSSLNSKVFVYPPSMYKVNSKHSSCLIRDGHDWLILGKRRNRYKYYKKNSNKMHIKTKLINNGFPYFRILKDNWNRSQVKKND